MCEKLVSWSRKLLHLRRRIWGIQALTLLKLILSVRSAWEFRIIVLSFPPELRPSSLQIPVLHDYNHKHWMRHVGSWKMGEPTQHRLQWRNTALSVAMILSQIIQYNINHLHFDTCLRFTNDNQHDTHTNVRIQQHLFHSMWSKLNYVSFVRHVLAV